MEKAQNFEEKKNNIKSEINEKKEEYNFNILKEENSISKALFLDKFINISTVNYDNQGVYYPEVQASRELYRINRNDKLVPVMNKQENTIAKLIRFKALTLQKKDIFYQFNKAYTHIKGCLFHKQMHRNMKFINKNELLYLANESFDLFNIITEKKYNVFFLEAEDISDHSYICSFDAYKQNDKIIIGFGKNNSKFKVVTLKITCLNEQLKNLKFTIESKRSFKIDNSDDQLINSLYFSDDKKQIQLCSNLGSVSFYDIETFQLITQYSYTLPINNFCFHTTYGLLSAVLDSEEVVNFDLKTQKIVHKLKGHKDHGFSCKFNNKYILATGNQDLSCKLWDVRKMGGDSSQSCLKTLYGRLDPIGNIEFITDDIVVYYENTDYFNIYDISNDKYQNVAYFGQNVGSCYHKYNKKIYIGYVFLDKKGLLVYEPIKNNSIFDNINL